MAAEWADGLAGITLDLDTGMQNELFDVGRAAWAEELKLHDELFTQLAYHLPQALVETKNQMEQRILASL